MKNPSAPTEAGRQYATAYNSHYVDRNLHLALNLYREIMVNHPGTPEAGYSRKQIQNIIKDVIPQQELLDAQISLTLSLLRFKGAS